MSSIPIVHHRAIKTPDNRAAMSGMEPLLCAPFGKTRKGIKETTQQGTIFTEFPSNLLDSNQKHMERPIEKQVFEVDGNKILLLHNVFTDIECDNIINHCELCGFESLSHIYDENYRNNLRVMVDDKVFTNTWYHRMEQSFHSMRDFWNTSEFICMNPRLRICKYNRNGIFAPHYDSPVSYDGLQSIYTVMAYLNDVPDGQGGATRFLSEIEPGSSPIYVRPKKESVVVFAHNIAHDGERLLGDEKYIMRSDIMVKI